MNSIEEILGSHELIFVDGSVSRTSDFLWNLYNVHTFEGLDRNSLLIEIESMRELTRIFSQPNTRTVPEVAEELKVYSEAISVKKCYLEKHCLLPAHKTKNGKNHDFGFSSHDHSFSKKEMIKELQEIAYQCYLIAKRKGVKFNDQGFKTLVEMVADISRTYGLKIDYSANYNQPEKDPYSSDSDERLASAVYWTMMKNGTESIALITRDTDFMRLFGVTPWVLGNDDFLPYNQSFREKIANNHFMLYIDNRRNPEFPPVSEYDIEGLKGYGLGRANPDDLPGLGERLLEGWKKIGMN